MAIADCCLIFTSLKQVRYKDLLNSTHVGRDSKSRTTSPPWRKYSPIMATRFLITIIRKSRLVNLIYVDTRSLACSFSKVAVICRLRSQYRIYNSRRHASASSIIRRPLNCSSIPITIYSRSGPSTRTTGMRFSGQPFIQTARMSGK